MPPRSIPLSRHWFGLPTEVADELYPYDEYEVVRDLTGTDPTGGDLFAGLDAVPAPETGGRCGGGLAE